jgi:imidazoleglycerol phosphate dehydratase HisB
MNMIEYPSREALMADVAIALAADLRAALEQKAIIQRRTHTQTPFDRPCRCGAVHALFQG